MIELRNVKKKYLMGANEFYALKGVSLKVENGESIAIMGPSGSGKSTLMNILGCLDRPTEGSYTLEGARVDQMDDDELAAVRNKNIGFVFQTFNLLARQSALENVELPLLYGGRTDYSERAKSALSEVGLTHRMHHKPNELSGGERQRVAIARAIVVEPALILADEPTGNLDRATGTEIMQIFEELNGKGTTIILVTHDREVAEHAKRLITIRDGEITDSGRPDSGRQV